MYPTWSLQNLLNNEHIFAPDQIIDGSDQKHEIHWLQASLFAVHLCYLVQVFSIRPVDCSHSFFLSSLFHHIHEVQWCYTSYSFQQLRNVNHWRLGACMPSIPPVSDDSSTFSSVPHAGKMLSCTVGLHPLRAVWHLSSVTAADTHHAVTRDHQQSRSCHGRCAANLVVCLLASRLALSITVYICSTCSGLIDGVAPAHDTSSTAEESWQTIWRWTETSQRRSSFPTLDEGVSFTYHRQRRILPVSRHVSQNFRRHNDKWPVDVWPCLWRHQTMLADPIRAGVLHEHGMCHAALQAIFRSVAIVKLLHASSAWIGFTKETDRQRADGFLRRSIHSGYCSPDTPAFAEQCATVDEQLVNNICHNQNHVLYSLLPPPSTASQNYSTPS